MQIIGLIPARSGSKGIKDKNIVDFKGKPLIAHTINSSIQSKLITRTIVSTDSKKYADIALNYGAEVPFIRPSEISKDLSRDSDVFIHIINELDLNEEDIVVYLRPTNPLRKEGLIDEVLNLLISEKLPAIRTLSEVSFSPYKMVFLKNQEITPVLEIDGKTNGTDLPRQLLPKTYELNGNVDAFRVMSFKRSDSFFPTGTYGYVQKSATADINYQSDLTRIINQKNKY
tara:strand:+ start:28 stop:714 length:687 start_codon:yes stop_codon:yes gene_type:complete